MLSISFICYSCFGFYLLTIFRLKMELSQYTYTDLLQIKRKIDVELLFRRETSMTMSKEMNFIYGSELIDYINKSENIDITKNKRTSVYTFARFTVMNHLYNKGMQWSKIGKLFKKDHSTAIYAVKQYESLTKTNFDKFIGVRNRIEDLIIKFNNDKAKTKPTSTDIQTKCSKTA